MKLKPISPLGHGIIDYIFAASLASVPLVLKLHKSLRLVYALNALSVCTYSALTRYPLAVKPIISFSRHKRIDIDHLAALFLLSFYKKVRRHKPALLFNSAMLASGIVTVLLTDWETHSTAQVHSMLPA